MPHERQLDMQKLIKAYAMPKNCLYHKKEMARGHLKEQIE